MLTYPTIKEAFAGQGENIVQFLKTLSEEDFAKPSRLPGWDMLTLAAHILRAPQAVLIYGKNLTTETPTRNRFTYYGFEGSAVAESVTQRARETAETTSAKTIADDFAQVMKESLEFLETISPTVILNGMFGPIAMEEYLTTRVLEMAVHSLDMTESLSLAPILHPAAEAVTVEILEGMLDGNRPNALSDNVVFIEAATGRKPYPGLVLSSFS